LKKKKNSAPARRIFLKFYTTDLLKRVERIHIRLKSDNGKFVNFCHVTKLSLIWQYSSYCNV